MKKLIIVTLVVISVAAVAFGQQVLSRNAVGYQQVSLPKGQMSLIRHDFEELDTQLCISNVFASLPQGSQVNLWKEDQTGYITINRGLAGWGASGSNLLLRGRGFWVKIPSTAPSNAYQVFLMGEVPDRFSAPTTTISVLPGAKLAGYPYPVDIKWTNTTIAKAAPSGSKIHVWNGASYVTYNRGLGGWGSGTNLMITPGMGFWLQWGSGTTWTETKPYTWP